MLNYQRVLPVLEDFGTHLHNITPNVGCLMTGMSPDARALVYRCRFEGLSLVVFVDKFCRNPPYMWG